ncbi:MAG: hypothetical protein AAF909_00295 [Pseudomonadota bacterium]
MIAAIALCLGALAAWRATYPITSAALIAPAFIFVVVVYGMRESALLRRRFFGHFYFKDGTWLRRIFLRPLWPTFLALLAAILPTLALCLDVTTWSPQELAVLAAGSIFLVALLRIFDAALRGVTRGPARAVLVKRWAVGVNAIALAAALIVVKLQMTPPDYVARSLADTWTAAQASIGSESPWIDVALQAQMGKEALGWWLVTSTEAFLNAAGAGSPPPAAGADATWWSGVTLTDPLRWLAWGLFLVSGALSAYGFSWFVAQLAYAADHVDEEGDP